MRDEDFSWFIKKFGEPTLTEPVPATSLEKWQGVLPDILLSYWENEGWASWQNGLISLVDPEQYDDILDLWLEGTPFEEDDSYHVFARSAFGVLYAFGVRTGRNLTILCYASKIIVSKRERVKKSQEDLMWDIKSFFGAARTVDFDLIDINGDYLFKQAVNLHGGLEGSEIFGFEPAIFLGGKISINNVRKLDSQIHLSILREMTEPNIYEI
ncbi:DUF1851 domain-containing protein [Salmonella enterica subsp. salamae]|nr:DUF1851 domain-containing protein [Salmonella enterica subsp. salamae]